MKKIKIRNFGPITTGFKEKDGFLSIKKVTAFIGNQSTGKSSIVKILSTLSWMEKALLQGKVTDKQIINNNWFINKYCKYQGVESYFRENTEIEFTGDYYSFIYKNRKLEIRANDDVGSYEIPKIMYVPAERNFLSAIEKPETIDNLPEPLVTFLEEFNIAGRNLTEDIRLPVNNIVYHYQKQNKIPYILGDNYKIRLSESSSGIQSMLPAFLVTRNIALSIADQKNGVMSLEMKNRLNKEIEDILLNNKLSEDVKNARIDFISKKFRNSYFVNIIEEIEQNLFPESQMKLLYSVVEYCNLIRENTLILTTHSPYIINYLTLAVKAAEVLDKIGTNDILQKKLSGIVPLKSVVNREDLQIYQLTRNGEIMELPMTEGIPSDDNYLNNSLEKTNTLYDKLMDIEE